MTSDVPFASKFSSFPKRLSADTLSANGASSSISCTATIVPFAGTLTRKNIRKHSSCFSQSMQEIIRELIQIAKDAEIKEAYAQRELELEKWRQKRRLVDPKKGEHVDVRDTEYIWCIGEVKDIYTNSSHSKTLLIHYQGKLTRLERSLR